jgi:alpha-1,2-mannosyltransferase
VPLIFILYLLLAGKRRQAAVASAVFAATVAIGFAVLPHDSVKWWLTGYFLHAGDFSNTSQGSLLNQSLLALVTRTPAGSGSVTPLWLLLAVLIGCLGLASAALFARTGRPTAGWVTCAVTGVLISPISWDNHWVWIVPVFVLLADAGFRSRGAARWGYWGFGVALAGLFADWPTHWTGRLAFVPHGLVGFDVRRHPMSEIFHLSAIQLVSWNLFVLGGLVLFAFMVGRAWLAWRGRRAAAVT